MSLPGGLYSIGAPSSKISQKELALYRFGNNDFASDTRLNLEPFIQKIKSILLLVKLF